MAIKNLEDYAMKLPLHYETYIFDLYGTLVDIHTEENSMGLWKKLAYFYGYYQAHYRPSELKKRYKELVSGKESDTHEAYPEIDLCQVFRALYEEKGIIPEDSLVVHTGQMFRVLSTRYVKLYPGTKKMLQELKAQNKKLYLLSNAQQIFTSYELHMLGIASYFDDIFISSDYGIKKPDRLFFYKLLEKHHIDVKSSLFVGNDSKADIEGASNVGLDTFYVCSNISPKDDKALNATYSISPFDRW